MTKQDIELLIHLLKASLAMPEDTLKPMDGNEIAALKIEYGDFDMLLGDYAITNVKRVRQPENEPGKWN